MQFGSKYTSSMGNNSFGQKSGGSFIGYGTKFSKSSSDGVHSGEIKGQLTHMANDRREIGNFGMAHLNYQQHKINHHQF